MLLQRRFVLSPGTAARLLQRLEGGAAAHPAAATPAAPAVDDAVRQRSRTHLQKALAANTRLGLQQQQMAAAAQVCTTHQQLGTGAFRAGAVQASRCTADATVQTAGVGVVLMLKPPAVLYTSLLSRVLARR